jgi:hypothetical protein
MARLRKVSKEEQGESATSTSTKTAENKIALARQGKVLDGNKQAVTVSGSASPSSNLALPSGAHDGLIERLTMNMVTPDPENSRIFPVIRPPAEQHYLKRCEASKTAPVYILLDKGVIENNCPTDHPSFKIIEKYLSDVQLLAEQIKQEGGLLQPIEVFKTGGCAASIVYGHMRYYSVAYNIGWEAAWDFKVLKEKPANLKIRQFVENHAKSDLSTIEKLMGFKQAKDNLDLMFAKQNRGKPKDEDYMASLAMKSSTLWRYNSIVAHSVLYDAMKSAISELELLNAIELLKQAKALAKDKGADKDDCLAYLIIGYFKQRKVKLTPELEARKKALIAQFEEQKPVKPVVKAGRKAVSYNTPKVKSTQAIKTLLTNDITKMEIEGVNWNDIDWDDKTSVNSALIATIKMLESKL